MFFADSMSFTLTTAILVSALTIFLLRVVDMSLDTLRMLFVIRGRRGTAWVLGFFQSLVFVLAIASVLTNVTNVFTVIGYAAGFATGNVLGMYLEERLAVGYTHIRIVSSRRGSAIADRLRGEGFAVTEIPARGKDGMVTVLNVSVVRKLTRRIDDIVTEVDGTAFITAEDVRPLRRGFWRA